MTVAEFYRAGATEGRATVEDSPRRTYGGSQEWYNTPDPQRWIAKIGPDHYALCSSWHDSILAFARGREEMTELMKIRISVV